MGMGTVNVPGGGESENQLKELEQKLAGKVDKAGDTMTGPLCVGEHARLSNVAGDNWGPFTLDSLYGDGFARLALICYGAGSDPLAIVQLFKENGEYVKGMALLHEGNIGSYALPLSGGTLTGVLTQQDLRLFDGVRSRKVATAYDDGDSGDYGSELVIGGGGNTFIGAGESPDSLRTDLMTNGARDNEPAYTQTGEQLRLSSDNEIILSTNANTIANRKSVQITKTGAVVVPTNTDYGTYKARNVAAGTTDLTAGSSALANGNIYLVYE